MANPLAPLSPNADPFSDNTPSLPHPAPLRYASFDASQNVNSHQSPAQARRALEAHLQATDRRIHDASKLGTTLLQQRKDLATRLREVEQLDKENQVPAELQNKLAELEKEYHEVGRESARAFLPKAKPANGASEQSVFETQARSSPSKVAAPSRRQRNQPTNRVHDIEFATEISTQLLAQVRQLQGALAEKEDALEEATRGKGQLENEYSGLSLRMKGLGDELQRSKDENWTLETKVQDLETGLRESGDKEHKLGLAVKTLGNERGVAQQEAEDLRSLHQKTADEHKTIIRQHEGDLHVLRREATGHETEKQRLQKKVDELTSQNTELAKAVSYRWNAANQIPVLAPGGDNLSSNSDADPEPSEAGSPIKNTPARAGHLESETLKSSLTHAHRMIQNLKNNIHREKTEKVELRRMLNDARDELEGKRNSTTGAQLANMSKKRRSEAENAKLKNRGLKPGDRLGANRSSTTEILEGGEDWEDHEASPTRSRSTGGMKMPGAFKASDSETTDAFETADETRGTETEAFETGAENFGDDSDELTETEGPARTARGPSYSSPGIASDSSRPGMDKRHSYMSTASTSAGEHSDNSVSDDEDRPAAVSTPVAHNGSKYRLRMSRHLAPGSRKGSARSPGEFGSSPTVSSDHGTPVPVGMSLGDELAGLDSDSINGSARSSRFYDEEAEAGGDMPSSPPTQILDEGARDRDVDIGVPTLLASSPMAKGEQAVLAQQANAAMLAHEGVRRKVEMVDAGVMTEPWEPKAAAASNTDDHADERDGSLKKRAVDVVGGALAGVGLGSLLGRKHSDDQAAGAKELHDDDGPAVVSAERDVSSVPSPEVLADAGVVEPKALRERGSLHTLAGTTPTANGINSAYPTAPMHDGEKVLSSAAPPLPTSAHQSNGIAAPMIGAAPQQLTAPTQVKHAPLELQHSAIMTLSETEPTATAPRPSTAHKSETALLAAGAAGAGALAGSALTSGHAEQSIAPQQSFSFSPMVAQAVEPVARPARTSSLAGAAGVIPGTETARPGAGFFAAVPLDQTNGGVSREIEQVHETYASRPGTAITTEDDRADDLRLIEPKVYGGVRGSRGIPTLAFGDEDEEHRSMVPAPLQTEQRSPRTRELVERGRPITRHGEDTPAKAAMADEGSQTTVSGEEIERMLRDKSKVLPTAVAAGTFGAFGGAAGAFMASGSPRRSIDSAAAGDLSQTRSGPRRPASANSMRNKSLAAQPPLPADHNRKIMTAAQTTGSTPATPVAVPGAMGPPMFPASAMRPPRTPSDPYGHATVLTPQRDGTTPRAVKAPQHHASVSSFASELDTRFNIHPSRFPPDQQHPSSTDPRIIQAITQTMIGEYLWKYTRKAGGGKQSSTRHRRFFWVHPYTRTLYWSDTDPSRAGSKVLKAKSLAVEGVRVVSDENVNPPGLWGKSIVVVTPGREIVFTAPTGARHETWFNALSYLLLRTGEERDKDVGEDTGAITEDDIAEFNPGARERRSTDYRSDNENHGLGFSIKRSLSRLTNRQSFSSYNSRTTARTASPTKFDRSEKDRTYPPPVLSLAQRQSRAANAASPSLVPTQHEANRSTYRRRAAEPETPGKSEGRFASITSRFSSAGRGRESFSTRRGGAQSAMSQRSEGVYDASVVDGRASAEDLRQVIERREVEGRGREGGGGVEDVRRCCDGKHDVEWRDVLVEG
ncbi:hypothetical protein B0A48_05242 [Cryoendolithus antarcticus]|uniref:PH domain-containing protein n=1 Tax=Cryoendolithus antarcticus TaxID=1507870 RepID=A0A1V8THX7_9PEZI|nr:hypothetical protein B0A48_05242 [Cryoendolithus antarcticus]